MEKLPSAGTDKATDERYCLACDKAGHRTTECHSTHGLNTPQARELHRLCCAALAAVPASADCAPDGATDDSRDAERYRWIRQQRNVSTDMGYPTVPWVVRCELDPFPTSKHVSGIAIDTAIDAAIAQEEAQ